MTTTGPGEKLYLVWPGDEDLPSEALRLVSAADEDGARARYVEQVLARTGEWLEQVYTNTAHMRFPRYLYMERGVPLFDEQGEWRCEPDEAARIFTQNVREFFGPHAAWADRYLEFYFRNQARPWQAAMAQWQFPDEMVGYMLGRLGGGWCELLTLALDEIPRIP